MDYLILSSVALLALSTLLGVIFKMKHDNQLRLDRSRLVYTVTFPTGTTDSMIQDWLRSVSADLIPNKGDGGSVPTVVAEVRWTPKGIRHILRVTPQDDGHVMSMLEAHIPGVIYDPVDTSDESVVMQPVFSMDVVMSDMSKPLDIANADAMVRSILTSVPPLNEGEQVAYQVILSHAAKLAGAPVSRGALSNLLYGKVDVSSDDIKLMEQRAVQTLLNATIRIAVQAPHEIRGRQLAGGLIKSLRQANSSRTEFNGYPHRGDMSEAVSSALTPRNRTAQLIVPETVALIAMPSGDPQAAGLSQGAARRLPATEAILSKGDWTLGHSDIHGRERPIAVHRDGLVRHAVVVGGPGTGKTTFLTNGVAQLAAAGLGIIVVDAGSDVTSERLFYRSLEAIPASRSDDIICINPVGDPENPVGINLFDQGIGDGVIDMIIGTFESLYPDLARGVSVRELLYHGLSTLIEADGYSVIDLPALLSPRNNTEQRWAASLIEGVQDPELKDFWARNPGASKPLTDTGKDRSKWLQYTEPIMRRLWQITSRPELRYLLGQTKSTINVREALEQNKIILFSVGGISDGESASLLSSLFTNLVWRITTNMTPPPNPNILFADEFQVSTRIQGGLPDMLARARALKLGVVLATQYITRESIPRELQSSAINQPATRIVFTSGNYEARTWAAEFGRNVVSENDITRLAGFHGIAQVANPTGNRSPVTFKASPPPESTGLAKSIAAASRRKYGRHVDHVRNEIQQRRRVQVPPETGKAYEPAEPTNDEINDIDWD